MKQWQGIEKIQLMIDNTSVVAALRKRWAESPALAEVLSNLLPIFSKLNIQIEVLYVPTQENLADPWSRNQFGTWRKG